MLRKIIATALVCSMVLGVTPSIPLIDTGVKEVQAASNGGSEKSNVSLFVDDPRETIGGLRPVSTVPGAAGTNSNNKGQRDWNFAMWHYSGGYWGGGVQTIYDTQFQKTDGGVANVEDTVNAIGITLDKPQEFEYTVPHDSELEEALNNGEDIYIKLSPNTKNTNVKLQRMFGFQTMKDEKGDTVFKTDKDGVIISSANSKIMYITQEAGYWKIKFKMPVKVNTYKKFSMDTFANTGKYKYNLNKYVPIPELGYGRVSFSMFRSSAGASAGAPINKDSSDNSYASFLWYADPEVALEKDAEQTIWQTNQASMPEGYIHPNMIKTNNGVLEGGHPLSLYSVGVPIPTKYDSNYYTIGLGTYMNAGAIGLVFDYNINLDFYSKKAPKVVASFVEVTGMDAAGNLTYATAADSRELTEYEYKIEETSKGQILSIPETVATITYTGGDVGAIANDLVISEKDILGDGHPSEVDWTNPYSISGTNGTINANQADLDYYVFGLVTNTRSVQNSRLEYTEARRYLANARPWENESEWDAMEDQAAESLSFVLNAASSENGDLSDNFNNPGSYTITGATRVRALDLLMPTEGVTNTDSKLQDVGVLDNETIYVRYVIYPDVIQKNRIIIYDKDGNVKVKNGWSNTVEKVGKNTVKLVDHSNMLVGTSDTVTFNKWVVSPTNVTLESFTEIGFPSGVTNEGTTIPVTIPNVGKTENIYVEWVGIEDEIFKIAEGVPQWRLSKFIEEYPQWEQARMSLPLSGDSGHKPSTISPSGTYRYIEVNPNGKDVVKGVDPVNQKLYHWFHSKAISKKVGDNQVIHSSPSVTVMMNGTYTLIKSTQDTGLTAAKWIESDATQTGLLAYDIQSGYKPNTNNKGSVYSYSETLKYGIRNLDTYKHKQGIYYHYQSCNNGKCSDKCGCSLVTETPTPQYTFAEQKVDATFNRYIQTNTDGSKYVAVPKVEEEDLLTTSKYQLGTTLNVYPEYGMLFANDSGQQSIKWVVGDQARKISPVVWQTLNHKVYVVPKASGNEAVDTRATTAANKLGESNKPVLYKGGTVNTNFLVQRASDNTTKGILTVKTYALDMDDEVKAVWGNGGYDPQKEHNELVASLGVTVGNNKATATEKLLVDSPAFGSIDYTGATKTLTTDAYQVKKYSGATVTTFTHNLIVRGGQVIGVHLQDKTSGQYIPVSIAELKGEDEALYNALIGMSLYSEDHNKANTVFSTFEHGTGSTLTEVDYANYMNQAREKVDRVDVPDYVKIKNGTGWYSEDTTVLVVKEYVTNYDVPSISFSDKLSLSVKGLETPVDKNSFFSTLGKGYVYLKLDLPFKTGPNTGSATFEYNSNPSDTIGNGQQAVDYLVPNVSVTDTTRTY